MQKPAWCFSVGNVQYGILETTKCTFCIHTPCFFGHILSVPEINELENFLCLMLPPFPIRSSNIVYCTVHPTPPPSLAGIDGRKRDAMFVSAHTRPLDFCLSCGEEKAIGDPQ